MKAAQLVRYRKLEVVEAPVPRVQEGGVLVRLKAASICGSDMRYFARALPEEEYPLPLGKPNHECAGVIEESRCDGFERGQRVMVLALENNCLSQYVVARPERLVKLPAEGDLGAWVMCQHVGTVLYACNRIGSVLGKRVAVLGQGGIGLAFTRLLSQMGAREVIVADLIDHRLKVARTLGATATVNAATEDVVKAVAELTKGEMVDVAVEAAGEVETANQAVRITRALGTVDFFGQPKEDVMPIPFARAFDKNLNFMFTASSRSGYREWAVSQIVHLVEQGRMELSSLITHRFSLDEVQEAYSLFGERRDGVIKVVVEL